MKIETEVIHEGIVRVSVTLKKGWTQTREITTDSEEYESLLRTVEWLHEGKKPEW